MAERHELAGSARCLCQGAAGGRLSVAGWAVGNWFMGAVWADVGGWLVNDSYQYSKPDISALVKHIDVTKAAGYSDSRLSMRVQKCIQAYLLCCQLGNLHGAIMIWQGMACMRQAVSRTDQPALI